MRYPLFTPAGVRLMTLREEEAQELYSARMVAPRGRKTIRSLILTVSPRIALGKLRGKRGVTSQASRNVFVEKVGEERSRLYQHDHERCMGYADTLADLVTA